MHMKVYFVYSHCIFVITIFINSTIFSEKPLYKDEGNVRDARLHLVNSG